jgi:hypothetical protein
MAEGPTCPWTPSRHLRQEDLRLFEYCLYAGARVACEDAALTRALALYGTHLGHAFQPSTTSWT